MESLSGPHAANELDLENSVNESNIAKNWLREKSANMDFINSQVEHLEEALRDVLVRKLTVTYFFTCILNLKLKIHHNTI